MSLLHRFKRSIATALSLAIGGGLPLSASAVEVGGQVYFDHPPLLAELSSNRDTVVASNPTYYFTLELPADAGEPLGQVTIRQADGDSVGRSIPYEPDDTIAFVGTRRDRGDEIPLSAATYDDETQTITLEFAEPVPPGTVLTLGLKADRNPRQAGAYEFGVTAYPVGDAAYGQFLGYRRLQFYEFGDGQFPLSGY